MTSLETLGARTFLMGVTLLVGLLTLLFSLWVSQVFERATGRNATDAGYAVALLTLFGTWTVLGWLVWWYA